MKTKTENTTATEKPQEVQLFQIRQLAVSRAAYDEIPFTDYFDALMNRHVVGDWGQIGREDWESNDWALQNDARILSAYDSTAGVRFWIITEADRSVTTVLLPRDY